MKLTRKTMLIITASLGIFLIGYSLARQFLKFTVDEKIERYVMDGIIFAALGLFMYNRKLASDERKAKEAAEEAKRRQEAGEVEESVPGTAAEGSWIPHWEREAAEKPPEEEDS